LRLIYLDVLHRIGVLEYMYAMETPRDGWPAKDELARVLYTARCTLAYDKPPTPATCSRRSRSTPVKRADIRELPFRHIGWEIQLRMLHGPPLLAGRTSLLVDSHSAHSWSPVPHGPSLLPPLSRADLPVLGDFLLAHEQVRGRVDTCNAFCANHILFLLSQSTARLDGLRLGRALRPRQSLRFRRARPGTLEALAETGRRCDQGGHL